MPFVCGLFSFVFVWSTITSSMSGAVRFRRFGFSVAEPHDAELTEADSAL